jgi:hypothetical protein
VAHMAERFAPGELVRELGAAGLASRTGLVARLRRRGAFHRRVRRTRLRCRHWARPAY